MKGLTRMVLIIDDTRREDGALLGAALAEKNIPSVRVRLDDLPGISTFPVTLVYTPSEHYLNIASVRCGKTKLLAINETRSRIYNEDAIFLQEKNYGDICDRIYDIATEMLGFRPDSFNIGALSLKDERYSYAGAFLSFTPSERMIFTELVLRRGKHVPERDLTLLFDKIDKRKNPRTGIVPVHICNLNRKNFSVVRQKLVLFKSGKGYAINPNLRLFKI